MATSNPTSELTFDVEHYSKLVGIIATWLNLSREIYEPSDRKFLSSEEVEDLSCAMAALMDDLSKALGRKSMHPEWQHREPSREIEAPTRA